MCLQYSQGRLKRFLNLLAKSFATRGRSDEYYTEKKVLLYQQSHLIKQGYQKYFVTTTQCLVLSTKRLVAVAKFLIEATKNSFVVPNFVAVANPFFYVCMGKIVSETVTGTSCFLSGTYRIILTSLGFKWSKYIPALI